MNGCGFEEICGCRGLLATASRDDTGPRVPSSGFDYGTLLGTSFNILIIDDDVLVARMLSRVLRKYAGQVYSASTATEARAILRNHDVNFLVCDFNLGANSPSGTTLLEGLRTEFSGIEHAVIFSGEDNGSIPPSAAVNEVLHKSRDLEQLCEIIRRSVRVRHIY